LDPFGEALRFLPQDIQGASVALSACASLPLTQRLYEGLRFKTRSYTIYIIREHVLQ